MTEEEKKLREEYTCSEFDSLYNFYVPGMNLRSTDLQAFIGLRAIDKLDTYSAIRNNNFHLYISKLKLNNLSLKEHESDYVSSFAIPVVHPRRDDIVKDLIEADIEVRPLIAGNMANKPMWKGSKANLKNCELVNRYGFYIPNHQDLTINDINQITGIINCYE